jgi:hypothetical protein
MQIRLGFAVTLVATGAALASFAAAQSPAIGQLMQAASVAELPTVAPLGGRIQSRSDAQAISLKGRVYSREISAGADRSTIHYVNFQTDDTVLDSTAITEEPPAGVNYRIVGNEVIVDLEGGLHFKYTLSTDGLTLTSQEGEVFILPTKSYNVSLVDSEWKPTTGTLLRAGMLIAAAGCGVAPGNIRYIYASSHYGFAAWMTPAAAEACKRVPGINAVAADGVVRIAP